MEKRFAWVNMVTVVFVLAVCVVLFGTSWKEFTKPSSVPSVCLVERSLKQFVVNQGEFSGSFFLGSGSVIGGKRNYYFYYKIREDNKFRPASVSLKNVSIVEDGQNKVIFITMPLNGQRFKGENLSSIERNIDLGNFAYITEFEFHIPQDSILEEYNPNLSSPN